MADFLTELIALIPPPPTPVDTTGDWEAIEGRLGGPLPADYKRFIATYGSVRLGSFLWVHNPFYYLRRKEDPFAVIQQYLQIYEDEQIRGHTVPFPLFPSENGLLPCSDTQNGDIISWLTMGPPEHWSIVVYDPDYPRFIPLEGMSLSQFLVEFAMDNFDFFPQDGVVRTCEVVH